MIDVKVEKDIWYNYMSDKMKVVIYGAGGTGRRLCKQLYDRYEVIAFMDTDKRKQNTIIDGIPCISEKEIKELSYDKIVIGAASGYSEIVEKLHDLGVSDSVIDRSFVGARVEARRMFLERYAEICDFLNNPRVAVAEAGVFRGEFAKDINRVFRQNDIFLYDTFEGFCAADIDDNELKSDIYNSNEEMQGQFAETSENYVLARMPYKERCHIRKGVFPSSFKEHDLQFGFVSLDMDLYKPMKAGLEMFYPRMIEGGVILVDDYFTPGHPMVPNAIADFEKENNLKLKYIPIGDGVGVAVIKN